MRRRLLRRASDAAAAVPGCGDGELAGDCDPYDPRSWVATARAIAALDPDLLIVAWWATTPHILGVHAVVRAVRRRRPTTRVVYWCHDARPRWPNRVGRMITRRALLPADAIVVHAAHQAEFLTRLLPKPTVLVTPLPALDQFARRRLPRAEARRRLGLPDGGRVALFFGIAARYKGLDDLLDALPAARRAVPDLRLVVAGQLGDHAADYRARIERLGIASATTVIDAYVPDAEVATIFSAADVLVLPYRDATQSGVGAVAAAFGMPVVATDVGGLGESVRDGVDGLLVPPGQPDALSRAIVRFFAEDLAASLAAGVRERQQAVSPQRMVELLVGVAAAPLARAD